MFLDQALCKGISSSSSLGYKSGAYLATHETRNFGGDTPKKGTTPKLTEIVKQIVYIGVIDPAESKSGLILRLGLLIHCHIGSFCRKLWKFSKN